MDAVDKKILDILQHDFPSSAEPYREIARWLNLSEQEVLLRIEALIKEGVIRRLGAVLDGNKLGFFSSLCACRMPENRLDEWTSTVLEIPFITHNYVRDHVYNVWFTLTMSTAEEAQSLIKDLEDRFGLHIWSMPAKKIYKIKVSFEMGTTDDV